MQNISRGRGGLINDIISTEYESNFNYRWHYCRNHNSRDGVRPDPDRGVRNGSRRPANWKAVDAEIKRINDEQTNPKLF